MCICWVIQAIALAVNGEEPGVEHHYYDLHGNSLEQYDKIWETLSEYYGQYLPNVLIIEYIEGEGVKYLSHRPLHRGFKTESILIASSSALLLTKCGWRRNS
jgi:hypothetical protein